MKKYLFVMFSVLMCMFSCTPSDNTYDPYEDWQSRNAKWFEDTVQVARLAIAQAKKKCGLEVGECYNLPSGHGRPPTNLTPEKEAAIRDAFQYYGLI